MNGDEEDGPLSVTIIPDREEEDEEGMGFVLGVHSVFLFLSI